MILKRSYIFILLAFFCICVLIAGCSGDADSECDSCSSVDQQNNGIEDTMMQYLEDQCRFFIIYCGGHNENSYEFKLCMDFFENTSCNHPFAQKECVQECIMMTCENAETCLYNCDVEYCFPEGPG